MEEKFDIDNFPTSKSALKMLGYVSDGFYDKSYVGKWLYQVMGLEYDAASEIIESLPDQLYVETATWGLMYHEIKWGLPIRSNLSYDERRRLIYQKRDCRKPMTPYRMETYLEDSIGAEIHIADINDPGKYGFTAPHPNVFKVYIINSEKTLNSEMIHETLNRLKQSHTTYIVNDRMELLVDSSDLEHVELEKIKFFCAVYYWNTRSLYDGTYNYDGMIFFKSEKRYGLMVALKHRQQVYNRKEIIDNVTIVTKRNLLFYNGSATYNGLKTYSAMYRKETIE